MPASGLPIRVCYEDFIDTGDSTFEWPDFDARSASSLFYTSGTTGNPKGVLYSHRSDALHALTLGGATGFGFSRRRTRSCSTHADVSRQWRLADPPMQHPWWERNWCCPARSWTPASIAELIEAEGVTVTRRRADAFPDLLKSRRAGRPRWHVERIAGPPDRAV